MSAFDIRPIQKTDRKWIHDFIGKHWGSPLVVVHETKYMPEKLPGFIAFSGKRRIGLTTYAIEKNECELVTLNSIEPGCGAGSALVEAVKNTAREKGCRTLSLFTTNDNIDAINFYEKRGFQIVALYKGAVAKSRKIKPEIPMSGEHGILIQDEIQMAITL